jgi:methyl-accepting chemotaxis protein
MSLKLKMIFACLTITATGLVVAFVGYYSVNSVTEAYGPIIKQSLPLVETLGDLRGEFRELRIQVRSIAFIGTDQKDIETYTAAALHQADEVERLLKNYENADPAAKNRASFRELQTAWQDFSAFGDELIGKSKDYEHNQAEIVRLIRETCPEKADAFYKALKAETDLQLAGVTTTAHKAVENENVARLLLMVFSALSVIIAFVIAYIFSKRLSESITKIAARLSQANTQVTRSMGEVTSSGNSLVSSSSQAAETLEETVASLEMLAAMVNVNSDNAKEAAAISMSSKDSAEKGEKEIKALIQSMNEISDSSKKIEDIINVIDDIAFQTNLLALNAAVEAARAGDHGKGFAVVAEAVRALAQRSAVAAKDISVLIKESVEKISHGSRIADRSGMVLNAIVGSVNKVSELNNEISTGSSEQARDIQQISKAMFQLDQSSHANAASAQKIATESNEVNTLALDALELSRDLNQIILGTKRQAA